VVVVVVVMVVVVVVVRAAAENSRTFVRSGGNIYRPSTCHPLPAGLDMI